MIAELPPAPVMVDVYWRPGCPYCVALRRGLSRRGVPTRWHGIWTDEEARLFVRAANDGDETVPTVRVGETTLTNPGAAKAAALAGGSGRPGPGRARHQAGAGAARGWLRLTSWAVIAALVVAGFVIEATGHAGWAGHSTGSRWQCGH